MKLHRYFRYLPKEKFENWIFTNFFSDTEKIKIDIHTMYKLFGFLCQYDFDPENGFIFTFRKFPNEKEYFLDVSGSLPPTNEELNIKPTVRSVYGLEDDRMLIEPERYFDNFGQQPLKLQSIESMITHNPEKYLTGKLYFLENYTGKDKLIVSKWWYFIPVGFRIISPSKIPYIDRVKFLEVFKNALNLLKEYPDLINTQIKGSILDNGLHDQKPLPDVI